MTRTLLLSITAVLAAPRAYADNASDAKAHVASAMKAHEAGRYQEALAELEVAYSLDPQPDLAYAIGQVDVKLGKCDDAKASYQRYLASTKDPQAPGLVEQALSACKPAEAEVQIKDEPVKPVERPVDKPPEPRPIRTVTTKKPFYKDPIGDALVVGGAAALAVGAVMYSGAVSDNDKAERASDLTGYRDLHDRAQREATTSAVLIGAGSALIVGGIASYVMRDRTETRRVAIVPQRDGGYVAWLGRF